VNKSLIIAACIVFGLYVLACAALFIFEARLIFLPPHVVGSFWRWARGRW
jgi:hypothetical protein